MSFFGSKEQEEIFKLRQELETVRSLMTPEMKEAEKARELILLLNKSIEDKRQQVAEAYGQLQSINAEIQNKTQQLNNEIAAKRAQIITFDDEILVQEFGLYQPRYNFANSSQYKERLKQCRDLQKQAIKNNQACAANEGWQVNGDLNKGKAMVKDVRKLLLRSFNLECDDVISKVKYNNFNASFNKISKSAESISKLGKTWGAYITEYYYQLKIDELHLAFEFAQVKEREKEEARELREQEREAERLRKEIEEQRVKLYKEQRQYAEALSKVYKRLQDCDESERAALLEKQQELAHNLDEVDKGIADVDYREANERAGYVYVISNVGSFGQNVYKIGMTRRLNPYERIRELGDASVPFNFDVHAMIFTEDAPGLEAALHRYFQNRKMNLVNQRREFFRCTLEEIKTAVKNNFDKTVEFVDFPDAEQYRVSESMRQNSR